MRKRKILIVEDIIEIAESIKKFLVKFNYEVIGIISFGEDAVAFVETSHPDLVLMDIDLAGDMDGIEAAENIHSNYGIPIIFITANDSEDIIREATIADPFGYILKPFGERELRVTIEMAFYKARIEQEQKEFSRKLESLHETVLKLSGCNTDHEVYRTAIESAKTIIKADHYLLLINTGGKLTEFKDAANPDSIFTQFMDDILSWAKQAQDNGEYLYFDRSKQTDLKLFKNTGFCWGLTMPIAKFGVFQILSEQQQDFPGNDLRLLNLLINHVIESINRINLQQELRDQAIHDPLTGVYNRFYMYKMIENIRKHPDQYSGAVGFLMIDVNRLKFVNDNFGHQTGDLVLKQISILLLEGARQHDVVIRYGGDEFLIMMPETSENVDIVKQRIISLTEQWNKNQNLFDFPISFAIGTAFWQVNGEETIVEVLSRADDAMYLDKKRSRE
ncbi:MAG: diguanylate cyclase [Candidatus Cloacimonetes bacterium]|nr:diguanylate cyclase [Candidatus Cloacimonadota bacterium]